MADTYDFNWDFSLKPWPSSLNILSCCIYTCFVIARHLTQRDDAYWAILKLDLFVSLRIAGFVRFVVDRF